MTELASGAPVAPPTPPLPPPAPPAPSAPPAPPRGNLDRSLVHSLAWAAGGKWVTQLFTWGSTIVVARLLSPDDYGLLGMATLYMGLVTMLSEMGFGSAIVMLRDLTEEQIAQVNTVSVLIGIGAFFLSLALAVPLGLFYRAPNLPPVIAALSTTFLITSLRAVPMALMQRDQEFRQLSVRDTIAGGLTAIAAIGFAAAGFRYWALALSQIVGAVVVTGLTLLQRRHAYKWPQWETLRPVTTYSRRMVVGRLSWYVYSNADFLIAGRVLGQVALGAYNFAWTLTNLPVDKITTMVGQVTPSFISAVQNDASALRRMLLTLTEALAFATFPTTIGIALVAGDLVPVVFGRQWTSAVPVIWLLACYTVLRSTRPILNNVLLAVGENQFLMWQGLASAVGFPIAFLIGSRWGIVGIGAMWMLVYPLSLYYAFRRLFRLGVVTAGEYLGAFWPALSGSLVMAAAVLGLHATLPAGIRPVVRLALEVVAGAAVFGGFTLAVHRDRVRRFVRVIMDARGRGGARRRPATA